MQKAIDETERRRAKQISYNEAHGITPKGVSKRIKDIIDGVFDLESAQKELKVAQELAHYQHLDQKVLTKEIKQIEKEMLACAKNLEFERAADLRDKLNELKALLFKS
jgi:excinuclease ABC subunit B